MGGPEYDDFVLDTSPEIFPENPDDIFDTSVPELELDPSQPQSNASSQSQYDHIIQQSPDTDEFASLYENERLDDIDPSNHMHQHGLHLQQLPLVHFHLHLLILILILPLTLSVDYA